MKKLTLLASILGIAATAHADSGAYMGLGLGYTTKKYESESALARSYDVGDDSFSNNEKQNRFGFKLYGGYQFNDNFAVEGGYAYFNKDKLSFNTQNSDISGSGQIQTKLQAMFVTANGIIPLNDSFAVFGKAGLALMHAKSDGSFSFSSIYGSGHISGNADKNSVTPVIGAGAEWKLNKSVALRAEYEYFGRPKVTDSFKMDRVDMLSVGVRTNFN